jgi:hypothetical protein
MKINHHITRRALVKSSVFGVLSVSVPGIFYAKKVREISPDKKETPKIFHRYPSINDEIVAEVVGASHFNFDRVKTLVNRRPELARATWDWAFGDWETALGAASHVGRRDIAAYLMEKGARPDIFTYAMLGSYTAVKAMIEAKPGIQSIPGPHGISLMRHVEAGLRSKDLTQTEKANSNQLIDYLEKLGDADHREKDIMMKADEKDKFLGDYKYGAGETEGFSVKLNMRNLLSLGKLGKFGGALFQQAPGEFAYNGISSVKIIFEKVEGKVVSLTVHEPDMILKATKI